MRLAVPARVRGARWIVRDACLLAGAAVDTEGKPAVLRLGGWQVLDPAGAPAAGAAVQVFVDGRGCVGESFDVNYARPNVIDSPPGRIIWMSGAALTGPDGVARIRVPIGAATEVIAFDRSGRRAVERADVYDHCRNPCASSDCGSCGVPPCTYRGRACYGGEKDLQLRLATPQRITGRVVDQYGRWVAGAHVMAVHPRTWDDELPVAGTPWVTTERWNLDEWSRVAPAAPHESPIVTDGEGRYSLEVVDAGPIELVVLAVDHRIGLRTISIDGAAAQADIEVERGAHIALRIVDPDGVPVDGALVSLGDRPFAPTGDDGRIALHGLAPGVRDVWVRGEGFVRVATQVPTGEGETVLRLAWKRHARIDLAAPLSLLDELGDRPLVEVRLLRDGDRRGDDALRSRRVRAELAPDGTGRAVFEEIPVGEYTAWISWERSLLRGPRVRVAPAGPSVAHAWLGSGEATLTGAMHDPPTGPVEWSRGTAIYFEHPTLPIEVVTWERDGEYTLDRLPVGTWVQRHHGGTVITRVRVRPGANHHDLTRRSPY